MHPSGNNSRILKAALSKHKNKTNLFAQLLARPICETNRGRTYATKSQIFDL